MNSRPTLLAILSVFLAVGWEAIVVHAAYRDNWTALFCIGDHYPRPPEMVGEYLFQQSDGYDGQFYQLIAHDPLMTRHYDRFVDAPRVRYRRILVPALAYLFAAGQQRAIDWIYFLVCWCFIGLGTFALARLAAMDGRAAAWGLLFLVAPATLSAIERMTVDVSLTALIPAALLAFRQQRWGLLMALSAMTSLSKETGILVPAAIVVWLLHRRRFSLAAAMASTVIPALAWGLFVQSRTVGEYPVSEIRFFKAFLQPLVPPSAPGIPAIVFRIATVAAVVALLWAAVRCLVLAIRDRLGDLALLISALFAVLLLLFQVGSIWEEPNGFSRIYSPFLVAMLAATLRNGFAQSLAIFVVVALPLAMQASVHLVGPLWRLATG